MPGPTPSTTAIEADPDRTWAPMGTDEVLFSMGIMGATLRNHSIWLSAISGVESLYPVRALERNHGAQASPFCSRCHLYGITNQQM